MKKIITFAAFVIVAVAFCSCKSNPVEPNIIGTGTIQYAPKGDNYYVTIDSNSYPVASITVTRENHSASDPYTKMAPMEGMKVTIFTSKNYKGTQAVLGEQTAEQIEDLYFTDQSVDFFIFFIIIGTILLIGIGLAKKAS